MLAPDTNMHARSGLASRPEAADGWSGNGIVVIERHVPALALLFVQAERLLPFRTVIAEMFQIDVPQDLGVSDQERITLMSCGPGAYLAVIRSPASVAEIQRRIGELAVVVDCSDNFTLLSVGGLRAQQLLARICSIDLDSRRLPDQLAMVTLIFQMRAYVWRAARLGPYSLAVPRSSVVCFWDALLQAAQSLGDAVSPTFIEEFERSPGIIAPTTIAETFSRPRALGDD